MRVHVTGAAGLYGVHVVHDLLKRGHEVIGVDNLSRSYLIEPPFMGGDQESRQFTLIKGDFSDISPEQIDDWDLDRIMHLAAFVSVPESGKTRADSTNYFMNNELGTFNLMQTLLQTRSRPMLIFASSGKVYGVPQSDPVTTSHPLQPANVYGATKLAAEMHCMAMNIEKGYPVVAVRNFNTYGENQNVALPDAAVIALFAEKAIKGEPLIVHNDGSQSRDFMYAGDAAHAYSLLAEAGKEASGRVFNLCSGKSTSIQELADTVVSVTASHSPIEHVPLRCADMVCMRGDYSSLHEVTGWMPMHSLEEGLEKTINWYRQALSLRTAQ